NDGVGSHRNIVSAGGRYAAHGNNDWHITFDAIDLLPDQVGSTSCSSGTVNPDNEGLYILILAHLFKLFFKKGAGNDLLVAKGRIRVYVRHNGSVGIDYDNFILSRAVFQARGRSRYLCITGIGYRFKRIIFFEPDTLSDVILYLPRVQKRVHQLLVISKLRSHL